MANVPHAIKQWWALVKPGGHMVLVVPDEELYEQGIWPSLFNDDHKASFHIGEYRSALPCSYNLPDLVKQLPDAEVITVERQDQKYDYTLLSRGSTTFGRKLYRVNLRRWAWFQRLGVNGTWFDRLCNRLFFAFGTPIDQTLGPALAQIQLVARKRAVLTSKVNT
jgi:hypothetical protein